MKTSAALASGGLCPECHNELTKDLSGRGFVRHKDCKVRLDGPGGVVVQDEHGQPIPCTFGLGERDGQPRNPNWTTDELILALDLYFRVNPLHTSESHPEIVALSDLLNTLPIHAKRPDAEHFRNPNGVYMKLCNFLRLDPSYTGAGLKAGSHKDEEVWNEFANDRQRLSSVAAAIRALAQSTNAEALSIRLPQDDEDDEAPEGRVLTRLHKDRERNRELVEKKKRKVLEETGRLECEVCAFDFSRTYGELGEGFIECHHRAPISQLEPGQKTRLSLLALVCANCHRMLHRGQRWPSVEELRTVLNRIMSQQAL